MERPKEEKPEEVEATEAKIVLPAKPKEEVPEDVDEKITLKPKKPKKIVEEKTEVEATFKTEKPKEEKPEEVEEAEAKIVLPAKKPKEEVPEDVEEKITLKPKKPKKVVEETEEAEATFKIEKPKEKPGEVEEAKAKIVLPAKKPKEEPIPESVEEKITLKKKPKQFVEEQEDVEATFKIQKPKEKPEEVEEAEARIVLGKKKPKEEIPVEESVSITVEKKKPKKKEISEVKETYDIKLKEKPKEVKEVVEEVTEETVTLEVKEEKKEYKITEEAAETTIKREVIIEKEVIIEEEIPEEEVKVSLKKTTIEESITLKKPEEAAPVEEPVPVEETFKIKKKPKKKPEEESATFEIPKKPKPVKTEDVDESFAVKIPSKEKTKPEIKAPEEETADITISFKKEEKPYEIVEETVEITVKKEVIIDKEVLIEEGPEEVVKLPKEKKKSREDIFEEFKVKPAPKEPEKPEEADFSVKLAPKPKETAPVEESFALKLKPSKKEKPETQDTEEEFSLKISKKVEKPKKVPEVVEETAEITVTRDEKKREFVTTEEAAEITIKKEVEVEAPESPEYAVKEEKEITQVLKLKKKMTSEDLLEEITITKRKESIIEETSEFAVKLHKEKPEVEDAGPVEESFALKLKPKVKKPEKPVEETFAITLKEEVKPEEAPEDVEEAFTLKKKEKPKKKVKPVEVVEEAEDVTITQAPKKVQFQKTEEAAELSIKKEVEVFEDEDIQEVLLKQTRKRQEVVSEEFKATLETEERVYTETTEESEFAVKLPRRRRRDAPDTGPVEQTFAITLEKEEKPEEKPEDVEAALTIQKKKKKKEKKTYLVEDEEESLSLELPSEKTEPKYEEAEESAKIIIPRKEITKEQLEQLTEIEQFVAMTTYTAERQDSISIVEGERVYVIERTRGDWWFVKKYLTHEAGFVPSKLLQDVVTYTHYMKQKIDEKIKKLPTFDKPKPGEKMVAPKFTRKLQPTSVPDGQTAQMECQVSGNPRPTVIWFRQTAIIKPSEEFQIFYDEDNVTTLIIREVFPEDAGTFTVVAKNAAGFATCSAELIVEAPLSDHGSELSTPMSRRSLSRESSLADILEGIPPVFAQKPKNQTVDEEKTVELTCKVAGVPEPTVTWFHDGKPLEESEHVHTRTEWDVHMNIVIVTIKKIRPEDGGVYDIVAENTEGKAITSLTLTVKELPKKPKDEPPTFTQTFSDVTIMENETVVLTSKIQGLPPPEVTWYKDGKKLKPGKNIVQEDDKDKHTLTVTNCGPEKDTGDYKCVAKNPVGTVEHTARVTVQKSGVEFLEKMTDVEVKERESATFVSCVSQEDAEVTWHKDGEQIRPGEKYEFVKEGKFRKLIIRKTQLNDEGEYTCVLGDKECTADLVVVELPPEIVSYMTDVIIPRNETATFNVELTKGDALVKWYKDGKEIMFSEHVQLKIDGKKQKLIISNATFEDMGTYSCVVGKKKSTAKLKVEEPTVEFTAKLPEKTRVPQDTDATFTVELSAPDVDVQWLRNGQPVTESEGKLTFVQESTVRKLVIRNVSVDDTAEYTCQAGNVQTSTKLHVEEVSAEFTLKLRDIVVRESDVATLLVEVTRETFEVRWLKDGEELEPTQRLTMEREGRQRKLIIREATLEDKGFYTCSLLDKYCSSHVSVEAPPKVSTEKREFRVKRGSNVSMDVPFVAIPAPKVEWTFNGKPLTPSKKVSVENFGTKTIVSVKKVEDPEAGTYSLKLKNKYGESTTDFSVTIIDKPKAPGTPDASNVGTDSLTLSWKPPESDGGSPVINYIIEFHDRSTLRWSTFNEDFNIPETHYKVTNLKPASEYMFRVIAVNEVGKSDPSPGTKYIPVQEQKGGEPPVILEHLMDVVTGLKTSTALQCKIAGQPTPTVKWLKNGKDLLVVRSIKPTFENQVATLSIGETNGKTSGTYTCKATNSLGAAETTCTLKVQELPRGDFPESMKNVRVKSSSEYVLPVTTQGFPDPSISWLKNGIPLESTKHTLVQINGTSTSITIRSAEPPDTGTYTLKLQNDAGVVNYDFQLRVLDKPGPPEAPITFPKRDKDSITVSWKPPSDDGGSAITQYVVEKCDTKRKIWMEVTAVPSDNTTYTVQELQEGNEYQFRISAVNEYGRGQPQASDPIQARSMFDKPSAPKGPLQTLNMTDTSFTLSWHPPASDGGCPLLEYIVEKKDLGRKAWQRVGTTDGRTTNLEVTGLKKQTSYHFRVMCSNDVGTSPPLAPEQPITPGVALAPPSAPQSPLTVVSMTNKTITISWQPPLSTGGSELTGYTVEKRETHTERWTRLETLDPHLTNYTAQSLSDRYEYYFRICAENSAGLSPPLENDKPVRLATTAERPSPPTAPLEMRATGPSSIMIEWGKPESDGGAPLTGYTIALRDSRRIMWMEVGQVDAETQRLHIKDVQEGHEYMVRIMAHNEVGLSDPLESDEPIKVIRPPGFKECFLPEYDEVTPSISFSTETSSSWIREAHVEPLLRSYTKHVLIGRNEYFFRVWHYADTLFK